MEKTQPSLHLARRKRTIGNRRRGRGLLKRLLASKTASAGSVLMIVVAFISFFAPWISVYGPLDVDIVNRLSPPGADHWFGTDNLGRDIFSRVMHGTQISAQVGFAVALSVAVLGLVIGLYASMYKWLDQLLMRTMDALFAFPAILLAIAIMAALGPSVSNLIICLIIVFIPSVARIVRSAALVAKEQTYVEAMHALGASQTRILWQHIMPSTISPLIVQSSFIFAEAIIVEAALSFLGAGIPAPMASLGNLLADGKMYIYNSWWMTLFPGFALIISVLAMNLFGDGIRDLLDPHVRQGKGKK
ncbi:ABC transporter permease [Paenibacillus algorifonticola]|uniref:ABC transporter permease n=1 Tax=Paenibacillus algorifonticola TaxID=684063 RepID=UPI003D2BA90A